MVNLVVLFRKKNKGNTFFCNFDTYEEMKGCDIVYSFEHKKSTMRFWKQLHPTLSLDDCTFLFIRDYLKLKAKELFNKEYQIEDWINCDFSEFSYKDALRLVEMGPAVKTIRLKEL